MGYKEIEGNLITLALQREFNVIVHGCNCFCTMGAGIAPQMAKTFDADILYLEYEEYKGDINKLGSINFIGVDINEPKNWITEEDTLARDNVSNLLYVVNAYTQYGLGSNHGSGSPHPLDYEALRLCLRKINKIFKHKSIGLPLIGCGLAGGVWDINELPSLDNYPLGFKDVKTIIQEELVDMDVTIVHFKP